MTIGSSRYELVIIIIIIMFWLNENEPLTQKKKKKKKKEKRMRMNLLVHFTRYTKVVGLVFGFNPLRNASGRKSDYFLSKMCAYQTCRRC